MPRATRSSALWVRAVAAGSGVRRRAPRGRALFGLTLLAGASTSAPARAGEPVPRPDYATIRYEEDFGQLRDYTGPPDLYDPIKYIPFDERGRYYLSLGGEFRSRYEYFNQPGFGFDGAQDDFLLLRGLVHADLRLGRYVRGFAQASSLAAVGVDGEPSPLDVNALALQQGFVELRLPLAGAQALGLRVGRQELALGSSRLVAIRKGPNFRRSFDMARLSWQRPRARVDALAGVAIAPGPGAGDDRSNWGDALWGLYSTVRPLGDGRLGVDAYYLGVRRADRRFADAEGLERRHSFGARLFGRAAGFDYNFEGLVQVGEVGATPLRAWTLASDTGYSYRDREFRVRVGLKADITSGDRRRGDGRLGTFDALYPNLKYFNEAGLFVPSNLMDLHPAVTVGYARLELTADVDVAWRASPNDAVYGPPGRVTIPAEASSARYLGYQYTTEVSLECSDHLELTFYFARLFAGAIVEDAGGRDVEFFGTWIEYTF